MGSGKPRMSRACFTDQVESRSLRDQIAMAVASARRDLGWTQRQLADRAGVSQSLVATAETGRRGSSIESFERIAEALGLRVAIDARPPVLVGGGRQADPAHARCIGALRTALARAGLACATEVAVADGPVRGWIDLVAYRPARRRLLVVEVKTQLADLGGLERQVDLYARTCLPAARALDWRPSELLVVVAVLATADADAFVLANRAALAHAFPSRGDRLLAAMLEDGPITGRGLTMIDPLRRGRRLFLATRGDGRRSQPPYRGYADFMSVLRARHAAGSARASR
jgi:transcriptional regulator with XRE-family HTH domain